MSLVLVLSARAYSDTRFSKKFVLDSTDMSSIKSNGLVDRYILSNPSCTTRRSAMNSMYCSIRSAFMPMSLHGRASVMNVFSISTASFIMSYTLFLLHFRLSLLWRSTANSVWRASSLDISSFENVSPGMSPRFLSQNMLQNEPEKNIPSTHANATSRVAKLLRLSPIHFFCPIGLFFNTVKVFESVEKFVFLFSVTYIGFN